MNYVETPDDDPREEQFTDEDSDDNDETINGHTETAYEEQFTVEVGTTVVEDKISGTPYSMYKATVTDTEDPTADTNVEYLGEHPADAVLGAIEKASGGVF